MTENIADIYRLTPMQQLMLEHVTGSSDRSSLISQFQFELIGAVDSEQLNRAWNEVVSRHDALRTCFVGEPGRKCRQVVRRRVSLEYAVVDLSGSSDSESRAKMKRIMAADRRAGIDLRRPPLIKVSLFRFDRNYSVMVWQCHHLILDRWCLPLLIEQLGQALCGTIGIRNRHQFRDYVEWVCAQDLSKAKVFWRQQLAVEVSERQRSLTAVRKRPMHAGDDRSFELSFDQVVSSQLRMLAHELRVTTSTVFHALFSIALGCAKEQSDVVYATAVSGRPADLQGVEEIVGCFANDVPVRQQVPPELLIAELLQKTQEKAFASRPFEYCSLTQIYDWAGPELGDLDTLLVYQFAVDLDKQFSGLRMVPLAGDLQTAFPLTVVVQEGECFELSFCSQGSKAQTDPQCICDCLKFAVTQFATGNATFVRQLMLKGVSKRLEVGATERPGKHLANETHKPSAAEAQLQIIWAKLLCLSQIGLDENFFDLGGRSFMLPRMLGEIESSIGLELRMSHVIARPTIRQLAAYLEQDVSTSESLVVVFQEGSARRTPIFWTPQDTGEVGGEWTRLGENQPSYGLRLPGWNGQEEPLKDVPKIASRLIQEIRGVQSHGPYALGGYCFGSMIALEIAQQLNADGEEIQLLALVDSYCPKSLYRNLSLRPDRLWKTLSNVPGFVWDFLSWSRSEKYQHLNRYWRRLLQAVFGKTGHGAHQRGVESDLVTPCEDATTTKMRMANFTAYENYVPQTYAGAMTLFRAKQQPLICSHDPTMCWAEICNSVSVHAIPGNHVTVADPPNAIEIKRILLQRLCQPVQPGDARFEVVAG